MKSLLFFTAATLLLVGSAVASESTSATFGERTCKWCGGERELSSERAVSGIPLQPQGAASAACHKIKERVGTRNGKAVYRTHCA
jgi:hypothetical protein